MLLRVSAARASLLAQREVVLAQMQVAKQGVADLNTAAEVLSLLEYLAVVDHPQCRYAR